MNLRDEGLRWLEEAEADLLAVAGNVTAEAYNWACFIAQQAAEKAVKAVRIAQGEDVVRIHSVMALIQGDVRRGLLALPELVGLVADAQELDQQYIPTRYPNGVPFGRPHEFYNHRQAERCLECAQRIVSACRQMFPPM